MREELASLIDKYNKKFYGQSQKPVIERGEVGAPSTTKEGRYSNKAIINPMAVPDPGAAKENYSWMYLLTPYYN